MEAENDGMDGGATGSGGGALLYLLGKAAAAGASPRGTPVKKGDETRCPGGAAAAAGAVELF